MRRYINLDTLDWQERADVAIPLSSLSVKSLTNLVLELQFVRDGVAELLPEDTTFTVGFKKQGEYDADYLASTTTVTVPEDADGYYVFEISFNTAAIAELLEQNGDPSDDIALADVMGEIEWRPGGSGDPIKSQTVSVILRNAVIRGDEGAPSPASPLGEEVVRFFKGITAYTGGASNALDSIETVGKTYGLVVFRHSGGTLKFYQLTAGTDAESSPTVIRPDDFDADDNAFVWKLQDVGAGVGGGSGSYETLGTAIVAGNTDVTPASLNHAATGTLAGSGSITRTYAVLTTGRTAGDRTTIKLTLSAGTGRSAEIRNATSGGTLLASALTQAAQAVWICDLVFDGAAWVALDSGFVV